MQLTPLESFRKELKLSDPFLFFYSNRNDWEFLYHLSTPSWQSQYITANFWGFYRSLWWCANCLRDVLNECKILSYFQIWKQNGQKWRECSQNDNSGKLRTFSNYWARLRKISWFACGGQIICFWKPKAEASNRLIEKKWGRLLVNHLLTFWNKEENSLDFEEPFHKDHPRRRLLLSFPLFLKLE